MFSKRQKVILSYMLYTDMPLKLELLADIIHVSPYTIRTEIESINMILSDQTDAQMLILKNGQYFIENEKKEVVQKLLVNPIYLDKNNIENHLIWDRIYTIMGMLSFESDYVSMEELAERLYVSKSTINLDITEIKRIISRISGIEFIVSNTKGLKLKGSEEGFRYFLAKMIFQGLNLESVLHHIFPKEDFDITEKYSKINKVLSKIMVKHQFIISGKAFGLVCANLLICAIRDQLGYRLEGIHMDESLSFMTLEIEECLKQEARIAFNRADMIYIQQFMMEQNHFYSNENFTIEDKQIVSLFTRVTKSFFQMDLKKIPNFETEFLFYVHQLNQRIKNDHDYTNFNKRQINRMFPMTSSIVTFCQSYLKEMDVIYSEAELAYITLFLGKFIEAEGPTLKILFISDEHTSLVNWIASEVQRLMGASIQIIHTIPRYLFEENSNLFLKDIDVILTTDQINITGKQNVIFIQSLFSRTERDFLQMLLNNYLKRLKEQSLKQIESAAIGPNHFIQIPQTYNKLDHCVTHMLKQLGENGESIDNNIVLNSHFIPNDTRVARVSLLMERPGRSKIVIGKLSKSITYRNKPIHTIVISIYYKDDHAFARQYYQTVRFLMEQDNQLGKMKDYHDFKKVFDQ